MIEVFGDVELGKERGRGNTSATDSYKCGTNPNLSLSTHRLLYLYNSYMFLSVVSCSSHLLLQLEEMNRGMARECRGAERSFTTPVMGKEAFNASFKDTRE